MKVTKEDYVEAASEVTDCIICLYLKARDFYSAKSKKTQAKAACALASAQISTRDALVEFGLIAATLVLKGEVKVEVAKVISRKSERGKKKSQK